MRRLGAVLCLLILTVLPFGTFAQTLSDTVIEQRRRLESELADVEREITGYQEQITAKQREASSLERDITIYNAQINQMRLEIRSLELQIQRLANQIQQKEESIGDIVTTLDRQKTSLAETLRKLREYDNVSTLEIMLSNDRLSDFFTNVDTFDVVQASLQHQFKELRDTKRTEETLRSEFISEKQEQVEGRTLLDIQKRELERKEGERKQLLSATRGQEALYRQYVAGRQKQAAGIRSQLFLLEGSPAIPFEKALLYAEHASARTKVRVAFILGVIAQESELGRNVGRCNLPTDPPKYKWRAIMKPDRDQTPYLDITRRLGLDPDLMPLSCPLSVGWGGAMGPAQFIPSTWLRYESKIASATGHNPPSPWEPEDAFMASAIYLGELGANSVSGETEAAGRYFAGSRWNGSLGKRYASQVLTKANNFQQQINLLQSLARN